MPGQVPAIFLSPQLLLEAIMVGITPFIPSPICQTCAGRKEVWGCPETQECTMFPLELSSSFGMMNPWKMNVTMSFVLPTVGPCGSFREIVCSSTCSSPEWDPVNEVARV